MRYGNIELHNVCEIRDNDGQPGIGISRLPLALLPLINKGAANQANNGTGCEIRGMLPKGGEARVVLQTTHTNTTVPVVSVYHGCFCSQTLVAGQEPVEIVIKRPDRFEGMLNISQKEGHSFDPRLVRVRLPPIHTTRILSIEGDLTYPEPGATPAKTLLCYGSSITHGACATLPEGTYAAQCARTLGYDLLNLGFGGSAHMDAPIAEHIATRTDWDVATLEMGINVRTWPREQFHAAVEHFVSTIVAAHPDKPVFCIDLFTYFADFEEHPTFAVGFRETVADIVASINVPCVYHIDGREILTQADGLRTDLVHPSDTGMQEMGANLAAQIAARL